MRKKKPKKTVLVLASCCLRETWRGCPALLYTYTDLTQYKSRLCFNNCVFIIRTFEATNFGSHNDLFKISLENSVRCDRYLNKY